MDPSDVREVEWREAKKRRDAAGLGRDDAEMRVRELELMQEKLRRELMRLRKEAEGAEGLDRERLGGRIDRISAELEKIKFALAEGAR